jgi:hypothetical protein
MDAHVGRATDGEGLAPRPMLLGVWWLYVGGVCAVPPAELVFLLLGGVFIAWARLALFPAGTLLCAAFLCAEDLPSAVPAYLAATSAPVEISVVVPASWGVAVAASAVASACCCLASSSLKLGTPAAAPALRGVSALSWRTVSAAAERLSGLCTLRSIGLMAMRWLDSLGAATGGVDAVSAPAAALKLGVNSWWCCWLLCRKLPSSGAEARTLGVGLATAGL